MKKLNNRGYMLVEIILASVIAFGVAYFIIDLTIKLKNKNDDFFVETQMATDQAIISNKLMEIITDKPQDFECNNLKISDRTIKYGSSGNEKIIDFVNKYATIGTKSCTYDGNLITITIPLTVTQMPGRNFNVNIKYKYI